MPEPRRRVLSALLRLRRVETDAARRSLGEALGHQTALANRHAALLSGLGEARRTTGEFDREAFHAWLERTRIELARLEEAMRNAEVRSAGARATLAQCRVAASAADTAVARERAEQDADLARRDQIVLEDVARAMRRVSEIDRGSG